MLRRRIVFHRAMPMADPRYAAPSPSDASLPAAVTVVASLSRPTQASRDRVFFLFKFLVFWGVFDSSQLKSLYKYIVWFVKFWIFSTSKFQSFYESAHLPSIER